MRTQSSDTSAEIEAIQIGLLRQASTARRAELMRSLSRSAIALSRRAITRAHPEWTEQEVLLEWAALNYGRELADRVRYYLEQKSTG